MNQHAIIRLALTIFNNYILYNRFQVKMQIRTIIPWYNFRLRGRVTGQIVQRLDERVTLARTRQVRPRETQNRAEVVLAVADVDDFTVALALLASLIDVVHQYLSFAEIDSTQPTRVLGVIHVHPHPAIVVVPGWIREDP